MSNGNEKTFSGGEIRNVIGEKLANKIGIVDGMNFNRSALMVFLRAVLTPADLREIVLVDRYGDDIKGNCFSFQSAPNMVLKDIHGVKHYFRACPLNELTWQNSWVSKFMILKCLIELGIEFESNRVGADIDAQEIKTEVSKFSLQPDYGFEYNFTTGRFSIRLPGGIIIRRAKKSAYPEHCPGIKLRLMMGTTVTYGHIVSHPDIDLTEWFPRERNAREVLLNRVGATIRREISSAGWNVHVEVTTDDEMFAGKIAEYESAAD